MLITNDCIHPYCDSCILLIAKFISSETLLLNSGIFDTIFFTYSIDTCLKLASVYHIYHIYILYKIYLSYLYTVWRTLHFYLNSGIFMPIFRMFSTGACPKLDSVCHLYHIYTQYKANHIHILYKVYFNSAYLTAINAVCLFVGCLTSQCISGTDLLRQFYVLPHWDRSCRSNFPSHPVTVYRHRADQSQCWPYNARHLAG